MNAGDVIDQRFALEREIRGGGMGRIFCANDLHTGRAVAVKIATDVADDSRARFRRESVLLAEIAHPAIVAYVAHGELADRTPYLVMEWLEGADLAQILEGYSPARQPTVRMTPSSHANAEPTVRLTPSELERAKPIEEVPRSSLDIATVILIGKRLAAALSALHARGIVHRDIKPGNLFLPAGDPAHAKLLDFGTARERMPAHPLTSEGLIVGTPYYMAPEQVREGGTIGPAADVWAVGCVLYECLTGRAPFSAPHPLAALARIMLDEPSLVSELRPDVPEDLARLVHDTLEKDSARRPADGAALLARIEALSPIASLATRLAAAPARAEPRRLTGPEVRVCALLFARASAAATGLPRVVASCGGSYQALADGEHSFLVTIESVRAPTDQAAAAARVAIALREADPEIRQVLVTGRGGDEGHTPMGELVDSAVEHLLAAAPGEICVDRLTAALIDARFHVTFDGNQGRLAGERDAEGTRTLLGKPSVWVGRRRELATLLATLDECADERVARAVLVLAPAGIGKSRLRHEMVRSLERRGTPVLVLYGQGDSLSAGSPFVMIAPALRRAAGILDGEPLERRREKLAVLVESAVPAADRRRITELLGEMIGVTFPDDDSELLRAARADKMLLGQQMERAWVDWLRAECARQPVLLVLEDLHWGDLPSVNYVDAALRALPDSPLMVLALARPEVRDVFPRLWEHREREELTLHALSPAACGELVRAALGPGATPEILDELVRRCDGNAFYLEELVRAVAEGGGANSLPETVIGMVQARLAALAAPARRVLRAAAVFGEAFWDGGVRALLGDDDGQAFDPSEWLDDLVRREVIVRAPSSRLPDQREYTFRHALLRDGAYELLTEHDRKLGHVLAGDWLVRAGEQDGLVLAGHFIRGGDSERAVQWYRRAAEQALDGNDLAAVIERAERAVAAGASGEALGEARGLQATAAYWSSRYADGRQWGEQAVASIRAGTPSWFAALGSGLVSSARLGDYDTVDRLFALALRTEHARGAEAAQLVCLCRGAFQLVFAGRFDRADEVLAEIAALAERARDRLDPLTYAQVNHVQGVRAAHVGDVATFLRHLLAAVDGFERAGDTRNLSLERTTVAWCWAELGELARAEEACRASLECCRALRAQQATTYAHVNLGYILTYRPGKRGEAAEHLRRAIDECRTVGNPRLEGWARAHLAAVHDIDGDHAAGESEAKAATELLEVSPGLQAWALAAWSRALLANGRAGEAVDRARAAMTILTRLGGLLQHETLPPLALARALHASGDITAARAAIADAHARLIRRAERLGNADWRTSFLALPDNALTLELHAAWCGDPGTR